MYFNTPFRKALYTDLKGRAKMIKKIALLDWDGTIRKDFTIRTWIKFLVAKGILPDKSIEEIEGVFALLFKGNISHDEASRLTAATYAFYLRGCSKADITRMASLFFEEDTQYLCSFSLALFSYLAHSSIQTMVISGAPGEILQEYQRIFPVEYIHALELQTVEGVFTGKVLANSGTAQEKHLIVDHLSKSQMYKIVLAAGNSSSDLPLLDAAPASIIVNNPGLKTKAKCLYLSCDDIGVSRMINFLEEADYGP
ncbi:MAG: HAD family hydrolase [Ktedonobacteraceae bacterium]